MTTFSENIGNVLNDPSGNTIINGNISIVGTNAIINGIIDVSNNLFLNSKNSIISGTITSATHILKQDLNISGTIHGNVNGTLVNNTMNLIGNIYTNVNNISSDLSINGNLILPNNKSIQCNKIITANPTDTLTLSNTLGTTNIDGPVTINNVDVNTKFTIASTGNTNIAGTLGVTGDTNLTGNTNINGTLNINNNMSITNNAHQQFTVDSNTGNTNIAGTLNVGDNTTLFNKLDVAGNMNVNNMFTVAAATGDTNIKGTLAVTDNMNLHNITISGNNNMTGNNVIGGTLDVTGNSTLTGNTTTNGTLIINNNLNVNTNKFNVISSSGNTNIAGTLGVTGMSNLTGNTTISGTLGVMNDINVNTNKFTVASTTGNTNIAGTLGVTGNTNITGNTMINGTLNVNDIAINTNKFTVASLTGNTNIAGTLDVIGASNLAGNININTDKFTINSTTGNTNIAGTLGVIGNTTIGNTIINGMVGITSDLNVNTNKFSVIAASGNTTIGGTLITNNTTVNGTLGVASNMTVGGTLGTGASTLMNTTIGGTLTVNGITTLNGSTINIGTNGSTVNIQSSTNTIQSADLMVNDKLITLNKGGLVSSLGGAGIEFEENNSINGYIKVATDRSSYNVLIPNNNTLYTMMVKDPSGNMDISGNITVNTNKFNMNGSTGNTSTLGTMDISGNTHMGGTLDISGKTYLINTLDVSGNMNITGTTSLANTTINGTTSISGNTHVGGILDCSSNSILSNTMTRGIMDISGNTRIDGNLTCSNNTILANTNIVGTANITGYTTIGGGLNSSGNIILGNTTSGTMDISGNTHVTNNIACTGNLSTGGILDVSGNINFNGTLAGNGTIVVKDGKVLSSGGSNVYLYNTSLVGTETAPLNGGTINLDITTYPNAIIELSNTISPAILNINLYNGNSSTWTSDLIGKSGSIYIIERSTGGRGINIDSKIKLGNNLYSPFISSSANANAYAVDVFNYIIPKTTFGVGTYSSLFKTADPTIIKWVSHITGTGSGINTINNVTKSPDGGFYVTGYFSNTSIVFNGSQNATMTNANLASPLTNSGGMDGFIAKYDSLGNPLWAAKLGTSANNENGYYTAVSSDGSVYVSGTCTNSSFTPCNANTSAYGTPINGSGTFIFIVKYSSIGNILWATNMTNGNINYVTNIAVNTIGDCIVTGAYTATLYCYEKNNGNFITLANCGSYDTFIIKYDSNGYLSSGTGWIAHIGGNGDESYGSFPRIGLNITSDDGIIVSNIFKSSTLYIFDKTQTASTTSSITLSLTGSGYNAFIVKYTKDGLLATTSTSNNFITKISTSSNNNIFLQTSCVLADGGFIMAGQIFGGALYAFSTNNNLTPFAQQPTITIAPDLFIVKYNSDGITQWVATVKGSGNDYMIGCSQVADGGIIFTGYYDSPTLVFYNSLNSAFATTLANSGGNDVFVAKYTNDGSVSWVSRIAGTGNDYPYGGIATLADNSIIVAGQYTYASSPTLTIYDKNASPYSFSFGASGLYDFSTFTFTCGGVTGYNGPSLAQLKTAYSATSWTQNSNYLNMVTNGIQIWTVPKTGNYTITCAGAKGGDNPNNSTVGGSGIVMTNNFNLTKGDVLYILVGQAGGPPNGTAGGGGGTFVVYNNNPLIIAGGGGGGGYNEWPSTMNRDGQAGQSGTGGGDTTGTSNIAGINGNGASGGGDGGGAGNNGGGYYSNGSGGGGYKVVHGNNLNGASYLNGGTGGYSSANSAYGGFGGGACGFLNGGSTYGAGGAGGYSGGAGGMWVVAGGGGSYGGSSNGYNSGHGYVTITSSNSGISGTESFIVKLDPSGLNNNPSYTFIYDNTIKTCIIPQSTNNICRIRMLGGGGGQGLYGVAGSSGAGGFSVYHFNTTNYINYELKIIVGGGGEGGVSGSRGGAGGYPNGGNGIAGDTYPGGGGGRSDIRIGTGTQTFAQSTIIAIAGGGGGGSGYSSAGGAGGGLTGQNASMGTSTGGTQSNGGTSANTPPTQFQQSGYLQGAGGIGFLTNQNYDTGGGGDGYYGGGCSGGDGNASSGGSGYINTSFNGYLSSYNSILSATYQGNNTTIPSQATSYSEFNDGVGIGWAGKSTGTSSYIGGNGKIIIDFI